MTKRFKKFLSDFQHSEMTEQYNALEKEYEEWKGNLPQSDDMLIIGIRF